MFVTDRLQAKNGGWRLAKRPVPVESGRARVTANDPLLPVSRTAIFGGEAVLLNFRKQARSV